MQGNARIINETQDWEYGTNVRARTAAPAEPYLTADSPTVVREFVWDYYSAVSPSTCSNADDDDMDCPAGKLFKDFDQVGTNTGSDLVLISFGDYGLCGDDPDGESACEGGKGPGFGTPSVYNPGPITPATTFGPMAIWDANEGGLSCPPKQGCFLRIGIDEGIPSTDDVEPTPPAPTCPITEEGPVCSDPLCKFTQEGCESPLLPGQEDFCEDGIDNDGVNGTDCADFGCDTFLVGDQGVCEPFGETSCDDEFDNDNNGFTDCGEGDILEADLNCIAIGACDDPSDTGGGGSSGCTVAAGPVTSGSSAANFLLPLLPLAGVFAVRRIIRRRRK